MRKLVVAAVVVPSLFGGSVAVAEPLGAAVGPCVGHMWSSAPGFLLPSYMQPPNNPPTSTQQFEAYVQLDFATTLPDGWVYADFLQAKNQTNGMEICIVDAGTGVMTCPWTDNQDSTWKVDFADFALLGSYPPGSTVPMPTTTVDLPVSWFLPTPRFLIIRRNVAAQGGWQTLEEAVAENGFCLVPRLIGDSPGQHFKMYGVDTTMSFPKLSDAPPNGLGLDPCTEGNRTFSRAESACVHEDLPAYAAERLEEAIDWQVDRFWADSPAAITDAWKFSSQPTTPGQCGGLFVGSTCGTFVFFRDHERSRGGGGLNTDIGRIINSVTGDIFHQAMNDPSPTLHRDTAWVMGIEKHEFFHQLQTRWNADYGFFGDYDAARSLPLREQPVANVGYDACAFEYPGVSNPAVCASASRIGHHEPRYNNFYFRNPRRRMFSDDDQAVANSDQFWMYVREQFATDPTMNESHPETGVTAAHGANLAFPVGDVVRATDEGADIIHHIWNEFTIPTSNQSWATPLMVIDKALQRNVGRGLASMTLDYHTALMLKDYPEKRDKQTDARFRLEWVGNLNAGATTAYFDYNEPPAQGESIEEIKDLGKFPVPIDFSTPGPDRMTRVSRIADSHGYPSCAISPCIALEAPEYILSSADDFACRKPFITPDQNSVDSYTCLRSSNPGPGEAGPNDTRCPPVPCSSFVLEPYGFHVASLRVEPAPPGSGKVINVYQKALGTRVRIFTTDDGDKPTLIDNCKLAGGAHPYPTEVCSEQATAAGYSILNEAFQLPDDWTTEREILILVSGGPGPKLFDLDVSETSVAVKVTKPSPSKPVDVGGLGGGTAAEPFVAGFEVADDEGRGLGVAPSDVRFHISGCHEEEPGPGEPNCVLTGDDEEVTLVRHGLGRYEAHITLPESYYPESGAELFGLAVEVLNAEPIEVSDSLRVSPTEPRRSTTVVIDASEPMNDFDGVKLEASRVAAKLLIGGLGDEDAVSVVAAGRDARTVVALESSCEGSVDVRQDALDAIDELDAGGCGSLGDGLFEAQSGLATAFDDGEASEVLLADCRPVEHEIVVLADATELAGLDAHGYYTATLSSSPTTDGTSADGSCGRDPTTSDNGSWSSSELRWQERLTQGMTVPTVATVGIGGDAPSVDLNALAVASGGVHGFVEEPVGGSLVDRIVTSHQMADAVLAAGSSRGLHRQRSALAWSAWPSEMPALDVHGVTDEMVVSVASVRDDTSLIRLVAPSGAEHAPELATESASVFRISEPEVGVWSWSHAAGGEPPDPEAVPAVFIEQAVRSRLAFVSSVDVEFPNDPAAQVGPVDAGRYVGQRLAIRAAAVLDHPLGGAELAEAMVVRPDGVATTVVLHDDGVHGDGYREDGVYGGYFHDTGLAGAYQVRITMAGEVVSAETYHQREALVAVQLVDGPDADGDNLPDWWELRFGGTATALDPLDDSDHDGLDNLGEFAAHSHPERSDSDGGGEDDASEWAAGANPSDPGDDEAGMFALQVAPGTDKALFWMEAPTGSWVEIERGTTETGPFSTIYGDDRPANGFWADAGVINGEKSCYRSRTTIAGRTSGWSYPTCVTPNADPYAPGLRVTLDDGRNTTTSLNVTLSIQSSDRARGADGCHHGSAGPFTGWVNGMLIDDEIVDSGVQDMMVSTFADFRDASWEPFVESKAVTLRDETITPVFLRVRDANGNVSHDRVFTFRVISGP